MSATINMHANRDDRKYGIYASQLDSCLTVHIGESSRPGGTSVTLFFADRTEALIFLANAQAAVSDAEDHTTARDAEATA